MATKFLTNLDLVQNQILNGTFEVLASDPESNNFDGRMIFNSTEGVIKVYDAGISAYRKMVTSITSGGSYSNALSISESNGVVTITPNLASGASAGLMSSSDYTKLSDATSEATANKLVIRDASGNIKVATPTDPAHAATKGYVDSARSGLDVKASVKLATNAALPTFTHDAGVLTASANGALTIDGATLAEVDEGIRILVKNETSTNQPYNGIYVLTQAGDVSNPYILTRADDADSNTEVTPGMFTFVEQGTAWADTGWVLSTDGAITLGTTNLSFVQFSAAGQVLAGDGLTKTGNTIDVVGTADRITANADSIDIASTYAGQASITTVGTISSGTWEATDVGVAHGGTGSSTESGARTNLAVGGTQGAGVSTPTLARSVALTLNGSSTSYTVQHGLGTRDVIVQVYTNGSPYDTVVTDVERTDANNVAIKFSVAPTSDAYRVVITG